MNGPRKFARGLALAVALIGVGCTATIPVQLYPHFYDPQIKKVAVVPFANETLHPNAGMFVAGRLASALKANGTYEVLGPEEVKFLLADAGTYLTVEADIREVAEKLRGLGGIDAFVVGTVTAFSSERGSMTDYESDFYGSDPGYRAYGRYPYPYAYSHIYVYAHGVSAAYAAMIRVADGEVLHATAGPVGYRIQSFRHPPPTANEVLIAATGGTVDRLVAEFAIVPAELRVNAEKVLRTARRGDGGKLDFTSDFRPADGQMVVSVALPGEAARNPFRLDVRKQGAEGVLASKEFTWSAGDRTREFAFSPGELVVAAGAGRFEVSLYSAQRQAVTRSFDVADR